MSIETIIVIILALLVLVIIAASFSGGMSALWKKIIGIQETYTKTDVDAAKQACEQYCILKSTDAFCNNKFPLAGDKTCKELGVYCPVKDILCEVIVKTK